MSNVILTCRRIRGEEDFLLADKKVLSGKQLLGHFDKTVFQTWSNRYSFVKPGISNDGTVAMEITARLAGGTGDESNEEFARAIGHAIGKEFGPDNLLSCSYKGGNPQCSCVVLPLDHRRLNPDKWTNALQNDQVTDDFRHKIETALKKEFSDVVITGEENEGGTSESAGYMPGLKEFSAAPRRKEDETELYWEEKDLDAQVQSELPFDQIKSITDQTLSYFTVGPEHLLFERSLKPESEVTPADFMTVVDRYLTEHHQNVGKGDRELVKRRIYRAIYQNYILEPLIDDDAISDIKVIAPDKIRVKVGGERYTSNFSFLNRADYERFIYSLAVRNHVDLSSGAIHYFSDVTSNPKFRMRFNITTAYINSVETPYLHIRKIAKKKRGLDYLLKAGMMDRTIAEYLIDRARHGKGLIFCGKGASGKTSLMNCLLDYIPFDCSGLVIQESDELFSDVHPDLMFQHVTTNAPKGAPKYDLQDEARNGLLTDLDYFIIGEVKGAEAKYFINAADTGHRCWCSVHAPSSLDAIDKLADYVMYETKYSKEEATYMLKDLGTVVFMKNFKVCEVSDISGWDNEKKTLRYTPIFRRPNMENR